MVGQAHLTKRHTQFLVKTKNFPRGFSRALSDGPLTVTHWCDKNAVAFFDNDVSSARLYWSTHEVSGKYLTSPFLFSACVGHNFHKISCKSKITSTYVF